LSHSGKLFANVNICSFYTLRYGSISRGVTKGQGGAITRASNHSGGTDILRGRRMTAGTPKNLNHVTRTFFNTVHLLPRDLRLEHGGVKLASYSGRHVTTLRPWQ